MISALKNKRLKRYKSDATETKFLLGGIGTGNISLGSRGQLRDFEIFNEPSKLRDMPYTFFSVFSKFDGGLTDARILEAKLNPPYERPLGYFSNEMAGLPRFNKSVLKAAYPFVGVQFFEPSLPLKIELEAFNPFIPLDSKNSGIPGFYLNYTVTNESDTPCDVSICGSFANPAGFNGYDLFHNMQMKGKPVNTFVKGNNFAGIEFNTEMEDKLDKYYGSMFFMTAEDKDFSVKPEWLNGAWWDGAHDFWDDFSSDGRLTFKSQASGGVSKFNSEFRIRIGSLETHKRILPGECAEFKFILAWHFPNHMNRWEGHLLPTDSGKKQKTVKNFYAFSFKDAKHAGEYLLENYNRFFALSEQFTNAMYSSTVDSEVIDALMSNLTVLRSPTCFRIKEEGLFLAWEGCFEQKGSCEGNCTHVWNYAQSLAFLFPDLEQSMRKTEFLDETDDDGRMSFRANSVFNDPRWDMIPAADGQLGCIVKLYRDWKFSGDDEFLKLLWGKAEKALNFAFNVWDSDGDFMLDSQQHNTYDIEFYGSNSLTNSIFFAALKAGAEMARYLGDSENETKWLNALKKGSRKMDEELWNGEYYLQNLNDVNAFKYQYGKGCLSDQVLGQSLAHTCGLGYILPKDHVKKAVESVFRYNYRDSLNEHQNVQRCYALNEESGLLLCSWPFGGRPRFPFVYADEVWSGIEYQVAAHLINENFVEEGLKIVKGVRRRYDGYKRNPFNEVECGNHYSRSLASYSVYLALCGYRFDLIKNFVSFAPKVNQANFRCFVSTGKGWGVYTRKEKNGKTQQKLKTIYGSLKDIQFEEEEGK